MTFTEQARSALQAVADSLGDVPDLRTELGGGILSMRLADGTICSLNEHDSIEQIWFASGHQSWQFEFSRSHGWADVVGCGPLHQVVGRALSSRLGRDIRVPDV